MTARLTSHLVLPVAFGMTLLSSSPSHGLIAVDQATFDRSGYSVELHGQGGSATYSFPTPAEAEAAHELALLPTAQRDTITSGGETKDYIWFPLGAPSLPDGTYTNPQLQRHDARTNTVVFSVNGHSSVTYASSAAEVEVLAHALQAVQKARSRATIRKFQLDGTALWGLLYGLSP